MPVRIIDDHGDEVVISTDEAASRYASFARGGLSRERDLTILDVDPDELSAGAAVEAEHTPVVVDAVKIALDHLTEHPRYYTALALMEGVMEAGALALMEGVMEAGVLDELIDLARDELGVTA